MYKKIPAFLTTVIILTGCIGAMPKTGIANGELSECPTTPNCVNSQAKDKEHYIEPIIAAGTSLEVKTDILQILGELKRTKILVAEQNYIRVEFASKVFGFIDDVEFYFADKNSNETIINVRSASRVGHSDLGVNRKRIEQIRSRFKAINIEKSTHNE